MFVRTAILICAAGTLFAAADLRPPALDQLPQDQFQHLLSEGLSHPNGPALLLETRKVCSIPLLEYKVPHPERFTMRKLPVTARNFDSSVFPNPAPACK